MTRMRSPRAMLSLVTALTLAMAVILISSAGTARAQGSAVTIADFAFAPGTIEVAAGTTVTWTNNDSAPHTVTADDGSFDSGNLSQGDTYSFTFDTPGTYTYFCAIHPNMTASVVVTGGADGGSTDDGAEDDDTAAPATVPNTGVGPTALHDSTSLLLALAGGAGVLIVLAVRQRRVV